MKDISLEEEANLPLPRDWTRTMRISLNDGGDNPRSETIYKNLSSGLESEEHPFLLKAMNIARFHFLVRLKFVVKVFPNFSSSEKGICLLDGQ